MYFTSPAKPGEVLRFQSKIVYTGKSSLVAYIRVCKSNCTKTMVEGFVTFIHVDEKRVPWHITLSSNRLPKPTGNSMPMLKG
jgi:acyl-CoA hydrolase